jgi:hypothetical protein
MYGTIPNVSSQLLGYLSANIWVIGSVDVGSALTIAPVDAVAAPAPPFVVKHPGVGPPPHVPLQRASGGPHVHAQDEGVSVYGVAASEGHHAAHTLLLLVLDVEVTPVRYGLLLIRAAYFASVCLSG